jgi:NAD(P)-dependent dehydrogenase (short-subunit alcohol dehydrogenase family)
MIHTLPALLFTGGMQMNYLVTGATGFIGKFMLEKLLARGGTVYVLLREQSRHKLVELEQRYPHSPGKLMAIGGDITQPGLGISDADMQEIKSNIDHFIHLAAIYDMKADAESQLLTNVAGTRNAIQAAEDINAGCFHHVSSIAASGLFKGTFYEDMFDEAENLNHPYFLTKHDSEGIVRKECKVPFRIYRPGAVVGHSQTGEIDKIDGPYYIFGSLKKLRSLLPPWFPLIGIETGLMNVVPVDYVVDSMDYLAHQPDLDGQCFHLTNPDHYTMGELINIFAEVSNSPKLGMRFDRKIFSFIPSGLFGTLGKLPPVRRMKEAIFNSFGMPAEASLFLDYDTRYDCRDTQRALKGSGIEVPRLPSYAAAIWDYWERHLDPDLFIDRSLEGNIKGKLVLVTGSSSGIGEVVALRLADAGAKVILTARTVEKLDEVKKIIEDRGGIAYTYSCDISNLDSCDQLAVDVTRDLGGIDILINNAGRSIRRSISLSYDRFHDFERTMQLNYFGALRLIMGFLPGMSDRKKGQVINISSIGVLGSSPRFSAYVASKSALDAFSACAAAEFSDRNVSFTTVNMPLVRTPMIAPTKIYDYAPTLSVDEAVDLVVDAVVHKPRRVATTMGKFLAFSNALAPKLMEIIWNTSYRMFPDSLAAKGEEDASGKSEMTSEQVALAAMMKGIHF